MSGRIKECQNGCQIECKHSMSGWGWLEVKFFADRWQKCGCGTSLITKTQTCLLWLCASLAESQSKLADQNVCNMKLRFQISAYQVNICQAAKSNVRTHVRIYAPWILPQQVNAHMYVAWNLPNHTSQHMSGYASEQMAHQIKGQVSGSGHGQNKHQKTHRNQWLAIGYNSVLVSQPMSELHARTNITINGIVEVRTIICVTILSDCLYHGRDRIRWVFWATWAFPDVQRKMLRDVERCWKMLRDVERRWEMLRDAERSPVLL